MTQMNLPMKEKPKPWTQRIDLWLSRRTVREMDWEIWGLGRGKLI